MGRRYRFIFNLILLCLSFGAICSAQEDCTNGVDDDNDGFIDLNDPEGCICQTTGPTEYVVNGDFETFDCCPPQFSSFACATGYYTPSEATTDYFNTCGFFGGMFIPPPPPMPSGEGCAGFYLTNNINGIQYREYVAQCLDQSLEAGMTYTLSFDLAGAPEFPMANIDESTLLPFGFYASTNCPVSWVGYVCPIAGTSEYDEILTSSLSVSTEDWTTFTFTFTADEDYTGIVLGPECDLTGLSGNFYFYMDNISITATDPVDIDPPTFSADGNGCTGITLTADQDDFIAYQWYQDGIAIDGGTDLTYEIPPGETGEFVLGIFDVGCAFSDIFVAVSPPDIIVEPVIENNLVCPGESTIIDLIIDPPDSYTFDWSNGEDDIPIEVGAGTYTVTITNDDGCEEIIEINIDESTPIIPSFDLVQLVDPITGLGIGAITATGGTPDYTYLWSDGFTGPENPSLMPGTYEITISDANGCEVVEEVIVPPADLIVQLTSFNATCNGLCNGVSIPLVFGGTPPYTFDWSNNSQDSIADNLCAGTYSLIVSDANDDFFITEIEISEPEPYLILANIEDIQCGQSGNINLTIENGFEPFEFQWDNDSIGPSIEVNAPGDYIVTITDNEGCELRDTFTVNSASDLSFEIQLSQPNCAQSNGIANIVPTGGLSPYSINWSDSSTQFTRSDLLPGIYSITLTDESGCEISDFITINEVSGIRLEVFIDSINCFGGSGSIQVNASGGVGNYDFLWSNDSTVNFISNVTSGSYTVRVTDSSGCESSATFDLVDPSEIISNFEITNATCAVASDGNIDLNTSGGSPPYTYFIDDTEITFPFVSNAGQYIIETRDTRGCIVFDTVDVGFGEVEIDFSVSTSNPNCGENNGSIELLFTDPGIEILWEDGTETPLISDLAAGEYQFTLTDAEGCTDESSVILNNSSSLEVSAIEEGLICEGDNDGSIRLDVSDETGTTYQWSHGPDTRDVFDLAEGNYQVTITDRNGCDTVLSFAIIPQSRLDVEFSIDTAKCSQDETVVEILAANGAEPYAYDWNDGFAGSPRRIDQTGDYNVTVSDDVGCFEIINFNIEIPEILTANTVSVTQPNALAGVSGSIEVTAVGGTPPYSYQWSNGVENEEISNLGPGAYEVTVEDANGCIATLEVFLTDDGPLVYEIIIERGTCPGACDGAASIEVNSTVETQVRWGDDLISDSRSDLCRGIFTAYIEDLNGTILDSAFVLIGEFEEIIVEESVLNESCVDLNDGEINLEIALPGIYSITWDNGLTGFNLSDVSPGTYSYEITDSNNCMVSGSVTIDEVISTTPGIITTQVICETPGSIELVAPSSLNYLVDGIPYIETIDADPGISIVEQVISEQCTVEVGEAFIEDEGFLDVEIQSSINTILLGEAFNLKIQSSNLGGLEEITWSINNEIVCQGNIQSCGEYLFSPDIEGIYQVAVITIDEFGCRAIDQIQLTALRPQSEIYIPNAFSPNNDGVNDLFRPLFAENTWQVESFKIFNKWGGRVFDLNNSPIEGWDGTANGEFVPDGVYTYVIELVDIEGETALISGDVLVVR